MFTIIQFDINSQWNTFCKILYTLCEVESPEKTIASKPPIMKVELYDWVVYVNWDFRR